MLRYKSYLEKIKKETEEIICKIIGFKDLRFSVFPALLKTFYTVPEPWGQEKDVLLFSPLFSLQKVYSKSIFPE